MQLIAEVIQRRTDLVEVRGGPALFLAEPFASGQ
jgi:hypothetical protein